MSAPAPLSGPDRALRRYIRMQWIGALGFAACMFAATWALRGMEAPVLRWALAAIPAAILIAWSWAFVRYVRESDEMVQTANLRAIAVAAGVVLVAATVWGLFETMLGAPRVPTFVLLPAFAVIYGATLHWMGIRQS